MQKQINGKAYNLIAGNSSKSSDSKPADLKSKITKSWAGSVLAATVLITSSATLFPKDAAAKSYRHCGGTSSGTSVTCTSADKSVLNARGGKVFAMGKCTWDADDKSVSRAIVVALVASTTGKVVDYKAALCRNLECRIHTDKLMVSQIMIDYM
jgi:hypothetical protein